MRALEIRRSIALLALIALVVSFAGAARAANDCLAPLQEHERWSCEGRLSNGQPVEYCVEYTNSFGGASGERYYKTNSTGMYRAHCTCLAKGSAPGKGFGDDAGYLCLDRETDTVVRGKATKSTLVGETFNVTSNVRSTFTCRPDPGCDVPAVVDPDLPGELGFMKLPEGVAPRFPARGAGGEVDVGYIGGCQGYTSEAPSFVFEVDGAAAQAVTGFVDVYYLDEDARGVLLMGPSGTAQCAPLDGENGIATAVVPARRGRVGLWFLTNAPEARVDGDFGATHGPREE